MSTLESIFTYRLSVGIDRALYPKHASPCCFYPERYWSELCHLMPQSKVNRKACHTLWGIPDLIDMPVINVVPGSHYANHEGYTIAVKRCDGAVVRCACETMIEWLTKKKLDLDVMCATVKPICNLFHGCNSLEEIIKAQSDFQYMVRNSHKAGVKHA